MQKTRRVASAVAACGLALVIGAVGAVSAAHAQLPASDKPAGILVWPKIVVDTNGTRFSNSTGPTDTLIQLSSAVPTGCSTPLCQNDNAGLKEAHCFYVNATGHCSNQPTSGCLSSVDCGPGGGSCDPGWNETDFDVYLTPEQPLAWQASKGLRNFPLPVAGNCFGRIGFPCTADYQCGGGPGDCVLEPSNAGSAVPMVPEDPFVGSLTCIQFGNTNPPAPDTSAMVVNGKAVGGANSLIGNATIEVSLSATDVDAQKYNAIGIQKLCTADGTDCTQGADTSGGVLQMGGGNAAYQGCPGRLVFNHLFDNAPDPLGGICAAGTNAGKGCVYDEDCPLATPPGGLSTCTQSLRSVSTNLTLVPCGNDFLTQTPGAVTAQFLTFNEFEQRFSSSANVNCFFERQISNIDTPDSARSIFSINVAGTLAGQTIIRGVGDNANNLGLGLLGVARTFAGPNNGAAYNLHERGMSDTNTPDIIVMP